jgi:hypothetical protein
MAKFRFASFTTFSAPVRLITPGGDEQEFTAEFVYLDDKQWAEKGTTPTLDFLRAHWTGWSGIVGDGDREIPFGPEQREIFLAHTYISQAVINAYIAARAGLRAKN